MKENRHIKVILIIMVALSIGSFFLKKQRLLQVVRFNIRLYKGDL